MTPREPKTDQQRLPRKRRAKNPPPMQLTARDTELLKAVLEYRFLTIEHFTWLFPQDPESKANSPWGISNRLRLLYHHGYLNRVSLPVSKSPNTMIYSMTEQGAQLLSELEGVSREEIPWQRHLNKITPTHVNHLLFINRVMIAFNAALASARASRKVKAFKVSRGEPERNRISVNLRDEHGRRFKASVVPDAIMPVEFRSGQRGMFLLEIDRATMTTKRWQEKVVVYREYAQQQDKLYQRYGTDWFILLTITTGVKRIDSLAAATTLSGGKRGYWFTTFDDINPQSALAPLWIRASALYAIRNDELVRLTTPVKAQRDSLADSIKRR